MAECEISTMKEMEHRLGFIRDDVCFLLWARLSKWMLVIQARDQPQIFPMNAGRITTVRYMKSCFGLNVVILTWEHPHD